jgi:hypothetical protein
MGFFKWLVGWLGLIVALSAVSLGLAYLIGFDDSSSDGPGKTSEPRKRDKQCGLYYHSTRYRYSEEPYDECATGIQLYCGYGAVSRSQLEGCTTNVTWGQIKRLNTNAARYSRFELYDCLADAGPFCRSLGPEYGP